MICRKVMDILEENYPEKYALAWDNVGLLAGRDDKEVARIYIALDATDEVIDAAVSWEADMIITHHPLIFGGLKRIHNRDFIGARILKLIQNDISYYAMHTNYDVCRMGKLSGEKMGACEPGSVGSYLGGGRSFRNWSNRGSDRGDDIKRLCRGGEVCLCA